MKTPITLPLPMDVARCLAHGDRAHEWCDQRYQCARHETIKHDKQHDPDRVYYRVCQTDLMAGYLPLDGFDDDADGC